MNRKHVLAGVGIVGVLSIGGVVGLGAAYQQAADVEASSSAPCAPGPGPEVVPAADVGSAAGTTEQARVRNLTILVARGKQMGVPPRGIQIGIATALVESQALNLASRAVPESMTYPNDGVAAGDADSIGIMQQRVSMGWFDTIANGMKVDGQVSTFFDRLLKVNGWQVMSFSGAAQAVQRSAFPSRYGQREADAVALYNRLSAAAGTADVVPAVDTGTNVCQEANAGPISVSGKWANPLSPARYYMTSPFGPRIDPVLGIPKPHKGQDLGTDGGTPIYSPCDGIAELVGWDAWGGGNMTTLNCGGDIVIKLMHQSKTLIATGAKVEAGQKIGLVGTTGNSTGNHLHEQVEFKGTPIDPVPFMRDRGVPLCARAGEANPTHLPAC